MSKVLKEIGPPKVRQRNGRQKTADGYIRGVNQALEEGAHMLARNLSDEGHRAFPENEELAKMAYILAPPKVLNAHLPPDPSVAKDAQWIRENWPKYRGKWVAIKDGELIAVAATAQELKEQVGILKGIHVTRFA